MTTAPDLSSLPIEGMSNLTAALAYQKMGWSVVPLCWPVDGECGCGNPGHTGNPKNIGKAPLIGGFQHAPSTEADVRKWWRDWPQANIGIVIEHSGLLIIDPDDPAAVQECKDRGWWGAARVTTGNGAHLYYLRPDGCELNRQSNKGDSEEIDVFTKGFVVAPPSVHASGAIYTWEGGELEEAPEWAVGILDRPVYEPKPRPANYQPRDDTEAWVDEALSVISPDVDMDSWVRVGMAIHSEWPGELGLDKWDRWSSNGGKYAGSVDTRKRWRGFNADGPVTLGTIAAMAEAEGWVAPWTKARERQSSRPSQWSPSEVPAHVLEAEASFSPGGAQPERPTVDDAPAPPGDWLAGLRSLTDVGNAERLITKHGQDLKYVAAQSSWYVWSGDRWKLDDVGLAKERAKDTARDLWAEADAAVEAAPEDKEKTVRRAWNSHAKQTHNAAKLSAMLAVANSDPAVRERYESFDSDPWLLGTVGGVLDLREAALLTPCRQHMISRQATVPYDDRAPCPRWERFVLEIMGGDPEMAHYLKCAAGYSLTGVVTEQVFFALYGYGSNGKGTFLKLMQDLLGEYGGTSDFQTFLAQDSQRVRNDIAALAGRRFVAAEEPEEGRALDSAAIKKLTSDEPVQARFLHKEFFTFEPTHKLWLATNSKPEVRDTTDGIWRRMRLIPFERQFEASECDPNLKRALRSELPGILRWAVEGCMEWQRLGGLPYPDKVRAAVTQYREEQDILGGFIRDRITVDPEAITRGPDLYLEYKSWAERNGHGAMSNRRLTRELVPRFHKEPTVQKTRDMYGPIWKGLRLGVTHG